MLPQFTSTPQSVETSGLPRPDAVYTPVFVTNPGLQLKDRNDFKRRTRDKKEEGWEDRSIPQCHNCLLLSE